MEFHLWGKAELEDMLFQPKNDRILFAFFGISLAVRKRSRTSEVRSIVSVKNRLYKVLDSGPQGSFSRGLLLRDINDKNYPDESAYLDFEHIPRWVHRTAKHFEPTGLVIHYRTYLAFVDPGKKEWDYTTLVDLAHPPEDFASREAWKIQSNKASDCMFGQPRFRQGRLQCYGLLQFSNILLIDPEGDSLFPIPHIYSDFGPNGPYSESFARLYVHNHEIDWGNEWTRIKFFPEKMPEEERKSERPKKKLLKANRSAFQDDRGRRKHFNVLYFELDTSPNLKAGSVHELEKWSEGDDRTFIRITHAGIHKFGLYTKLLRDEWAELENAEQQLNRMPEADEKIFVVEFEFAYPHQWDSSED
ncbi:hypothetical protein HAD_01980 [Hyphomonas adhaerens MHS-3]|uniref:Uncharacterized protein n=2 Tax=Hyphomonas adhaerens TaxID=81029 RepID=A0A069E3J6_9PROT|nr:hypothetical protein HAD_01980 [Hyphomonas adhaerens MHS-3]